MLNKMAILQLGKCRVCISPLFAIVEIVIISCCIQAIAAIHDLGLHSIDHMVISFLILVGSMGCLFMHEYAHVLAAQRMGLTVREIIVSLFGAYTSLDGEPLQPKEALVVSIAGPVSNILAGIILYAGHLAFLKSDIISTVFFCLSIFNGVLSAYNLMPVMPLDGGMIVRSTLWLLSGNWTWSTRRALLIGNGFAVVCIIAGIILIFMHTAIMSAVSFLLGLSLWQNDKLVYQQMLTANILNIVNPKGYRKEVMRDAVR